MEASAELSRCGRYRYALRRCWDAFAPLVLFVGLNPSAADGTADDPTSRVCMGYARRWGYGGLLIGNLFALRSTDPAALRAAPDPVGPRNDERLLALEDAAALVVCAWGEGGAYGDRDRDVLPRLRAPHCLVRLRSGRPGHPLYKRADLEPVPL